MQTIKTTWAQSLKDATQALRQTPLEVLLGVAVALMCSLSIEDRDMREVGVRVALAAWPTLFAIFATSVLHHFRAISAGVRWSMSLTYLLAGGGLAWWLDVHMQTRVWAWGSLTTAVMLGFGLLPLALVRQDGAVREFFWSFNARMLHRMMTFAAYCGVLFFGLVLGLLGVDNLLGVKVPDDMIGHLFVWITCALYPWLVAAGMPYLGSDRPFLNADGRVMIERICTYLFLPLTALYVAILYLYNARILITGLSEAPKNVMSPLALSAAGMLLLGMILADQLRRSAVGSQGVFVRAIRVMPTIFLPLVPLTAWAVIVRIMQHGWTEFRYMRLLVVVCIALVFIASTVQLIRKREQPLTFGLVVFAVAMMLATIGPWSASSVTRRSQQRVLDGLLAQHPHLLDASGRLRVSADTTARESVKGAYEVRKQLRFLKERFGPADLERLAPTPEAAAQLKDVSPGDAWHRILHASVLRHARYNDPSIARSIYYYQSDITFALPHGGLMTRRTVSLPDRSEATPSRPKLWLEKGHLVIRTADGQEGAGDMRALRDQIVAAKHLHTATMQSVAPHATIALRSMRGGDGCGVVLGSFLVEAANLDRKGDGWDFSRHNAVTGHLILLKQPRALDCME